MSLASKRPGRKNTAADIWLIRPTHPVLIAASALAAALRPSYDIIFCGQRAIDDDSAVGSILAELLPYLITVLQSGCERQPQGRAPVEGAQLLIESPCPFATTRRD